MANVIAATRDGVDRLGEVPNGNWSGLWSGNTIKARCGYSDWTFITDVGVRGVNEPCTVTVRNGTITVHPGSNVGWITRYAEAPGQVEREWIVRDVIQHPDGLENGIHELFREALKRR